MSVKYLTFILSCTFVLILSTQVFAIKVEKVNEADQLFNNGNKALAKFEFKKAFGYFKKSCEIGNNNACANLKGQFPGGWNLDKIDELSYYSMLYFKFVSADNQKSNSNAVKLGTLMIETKSSDAKRNAQSYFLRAQAYLNNKQLDRSLSDANKGLSLHPKDTTGLRLRATTYLNMNQIDNALADANKVITAEPDVLGYALRMFIYIKMKQFDNALVDANKAIEANPYVGYEYRATFYSYTNNKDGVKDDFNNWLRVCQNCGDEKVFNERIAYYIDSHLK